MPVRRVALQIDPIGSLKPATDSSRLLGLEAQRRGYELYYYTPDKLTWRDGRITARGYPLTLHADDAHFYDLGEEQTLDLASMDVILLRQNPPFDMAYITTTYLLEMLHPKPLVVNNPASVRNFPEKIMPALLREFMPPTLITADIREIEAFCHAHQDIVVKPLYDFGGRSVLRLTPDDRNMHALLSMVFASGKEPLMAQLLLPEIAEGDRRVTMIDGQIAGVIARVPPKGDIRSNMAIGATAEKATLTPRQKKICETLGPLLTQHGIILAGIDLIGDYLIEVNMTSPATMIIPNRELYGIRLDEQFWDAVEARLG